MRKIICLLLIALVSIISGCGLTSIPEAHLTDNNENSSEDIPGPTEPAPRFGGELRVSLTAPDTFNPLLTQSRDIMNFLSLVFESPIEYDENLKPVPSLVTNWEASPDGRLWVFDVRKGVKWHNGESFSGEDILFTLQVLQSDTLESFYQKNLFVDMNIVEYGLRSGDPYTIYIRLGEPSYHILDYLTFPVLPRSVYQSAEFIMESKSDFSLLPVGTGPYRVDPTHPYEGETIKLVKNESWWDGTPYIDSILGKIYATNDEAWDAFYQNDVDLVDTTVVYANTRLNRNNANHYKYLTSDFELLALNNTHALFQEKVIKKAMAYGIDRKDIISKVYLNNAETVDVPIPSNSWLYDSSYRIYDYDVERASRLLEEAGWRDHDGDGILDREIDGTKVDLSFTILTNSDNDLRKDTADLIAEQLGTIGFQIQVEVLPWDLLQEERIATGEFDAILTGFSLDSMHDLRSVLHSGWMGEQGNNFISYNNPELDRMLERAAEAYTEEDRLEAYLGIQEHLTDELPFISLYFRTGSLLADSRVHGIDSIGELSTFKNVEDWFLIR
ncbi:MAG: ABC transporter substrate-binding protein [Caldicoprobacterales bacterium]|jgi:peptide/nickel transport system substrate-binding protein